MQELFSKNRVSRKLFPAADPTEPIPQKRTGEGTAAVEYDIGNLPAATGDMRLDGFIDRRDSDKHDNRQRDSKRTVFPVDIDRVSHENA